MSVSKKTCFYTATGHPLTPKEEKFISAYVETTNGAKAAVMAGYSERTAKMTANKLLTKPYLCDEINNRLAKVKEQGIASAEEIMKYFTDVMRGNIKDQFELEAPLSERTKAAQELAKRQIDIPNKLAGNEVPEVKITLNWEGLD